MALSKEEGNQLLDWYEDLLTERQRDILDLYYREDLSLSEIAENLAITRSAVSDSINKTMKQLENYESKLSLVKKFQMRQEIYRQLNDLDNETVRELVEKLMNLE